MTDTKATPTDRLLAGLDAMGAAYNMPPGTTAGRLMLDAAKEIRALRTALTPTTDGEREAREALFFADRDHAAGFRCVPEPIHRALSTALNLLATERAKAADAARERDEARQNERRLGYAIDAVREAIEAGTGFGAMYIKDPRVESMVSAIIAHDRELSDNARAEIAKHTAAAEDAMHQRDRAFATIDELQGRLAAIERGAHTKVTP